MTIPLPGTLTSDQGTREMQRRWSLSVVIPVFNAGKIIQETVMLLRSHFEARGFDYEVIVVDDGSRDHPNPFGTLSTEGASWLRLVRHGCHQGKGAAVRQGVLAASKEYVLVLDADLSVPIEELDALLLEMENGSDIAIGSRMVPGAQVFNQPLHRYVMRRLLNLFVRRWLFEGIYDTQCGFKCFRRMIAQDLFRVQRIKGFAFELEILELARRSGRRICEVPVRYIHNSRASTIRPVRDSCVVLRDVLKILWSRRARGRA